MISRTMRATDELQVLMDFYYHTVPVVPHGEGVFCYKGEVLDGGLAPGDYGMASGDRIDFFLEMRPDTFVTVTVRDARGPEVTRTMRMTDAMQDLFEFYFEMTAHVDRGTGRFVFDGKRVKGEHTPEDLGMVNGDKIDFFEDLLAG
ncbi:hypothetical protein HU200_054762 [Digitaria exilis]|uniref:Ubiquitin-like domain-containing protein n=1 Tax=Digitaria exilis TaxID=1010633 RepID=A0A835AFN2_9POAL|nr:hypothetical protein HU200_054762 [Digitaria exilis]